MVNPSLTPVPLDHLSTGCGRFGTEPRFCGVVFNWKSALSVPAGGTSKVMLPSRQESGKRHLPGMLSPGGTSPGNVKLTRCFPTNAPRCCRVASTVLNVNLPSEFVLPSDGGPAISLDPEAAVGRNVTATLSIGFPSTVMCPETGARRNPSPHPATHKTTPTDMTAANRRADWARCLLENISTPPRLQGHEATIHRGAPSVGVTSVWAAPNNPASIGCGDFTASNRAHGDENVQIDISVD